MRMAARSRADGGIFYGFGFALSGLRVFILIALWRTLAESGGEVATYSFVALATYTILAEVFAEPLAARTELRDTIWNGSVVGRALQPIGLVGTYTAEALGRWSLRFLTFGPIALVLGAATGHLIAPVSPLPVVLLSLVLAVSVGLAIEFIFGSIIIGTRSNVWVIEQLRGATVVLLSGQMIPLALLPWGLGDVLRWSPFASVASAPLTLYVGTSEAIGTLALQTFWAVTLWLIAGWAWARSRTRLSALGG